MKALVLAAGKGTRLKHLTAHFPKPMLQVGDAPLLSHIVAWLRRHDVTEIAMNLHHAPTTITHYFGDGQAHGVSISYSYEQELLGTAGAAKKLQSFLDETFVVVYGDVLTNLDLTRLNAFHLSCREKCTSPYALSLALYRVPNPTECGLVELDDAGRIHRFVEKPPPDQVFTELANAGILVCDPAILTLVPSDQVFDFGHDLVPLLLSQGVPVFGQTILDHEYVIDIGTMAGYDRAQQVVRSKG